MLPDFPREKNLVGKELLEFVRGRTRTLMGPFGSVTRYRDHEGNKQKIIRSDGSVSESGYKEISSEFTIRLSEIREMSAEELVKELDRVAQDMARQASVHAFETINEAVERVGNVVSGKGRELNPELMLEALEKMEIDFDAKGDPILPSIMVGPKLAEKLRERIPKWETEYPDFSRRLEELLKVKREKWRDRQASRRLVD